MKDFWLPTVLHFNRATPDNLKARFENLRKSKKDLSHLGDFE